MKEYDLLRLLRRMDLPVFSELEFSDPLALFRAHFLLFHLLYTLGDRLHHEQKGHLEIHCLRIILIPWGSAGEGHPERYETLRDYYRDLTKMEEMKRADVDRLIETFWREFFRYHRRPESLEILGLEHTATPAEIKRRFRKLALIHHPDCGGDPEMFHRITEAAESLL